MSKTYWSNQKQVIMDEITIIGSDPLSQESATDYVNTVMAANKHTPVNNGDNGHASVSTDTSRKRQYSDDQSDYMDDNNDPSEQEHVHVAKKQRASDNEQTEYIDNKTIYDMFQTLSLQMETLYGDLNKRMSSMEANIELKLTQKLKNALDSKVESELENVRGEIKDQVDIVREEMRSEMKSLKTSYSDIVKKSPTPSIENEQRKTRFVVKNLSEDANEKNDNRITMNKINSLVKDGLKLKSVKVQKVERKQNKGKGHGTVIVTV